VTAKRTTNGQLIDADVPLEALVTSPKLRGSTTVTALDTRIAASPTVLAIVVDPTVPAIDRDAARRAVRDLLALLGQDTHDPELGETPRRVVAALEELLTPAPFQMTTFANDEGYDELDIARDIPVRSL